MSWVVIDKDRCNKCGLCAVRCIRCFSHKEDEINVHADEDTCNLCGHCVSLCPTDAILHNKMNMNHFEAIDDRVSFDTTEFIQFIQRRRSHRHFKDQEIPREHLETLVDLCRYAPTGSNKQTVEIKIIQDQEKIKRLSDHTVDFFMDMIRQVKEQVEQFKAQGKDVPNDVQSLHINLSRYKDMGLAREFGLDVIFYRAPVVMIFHSPTDSSTPKDDCVIAAQTVTMTAMTMGLGTCYIGLFEAAAKSYPPIGEELSLPPGNKVFSVLIMGYPRLKYLRTVDRRPIKATWE